MRHNKEVIVELTVKCKPWSAESAGLHKVLVDGDDYVRVWDPVAGHYTVCHSLSQADCKRIVRQARTADRA